MSPAMMSPAQERKTTYDVKGNMKLEMQAENASATGAEKTVAKVSKKSSNRPKHAKLAKEEDTSSSDSDTDECYEPFSMEAWRYPMYSPSASYRQVDVVSGSHQYTISGFSLARSMGCGTRLCSDFFEVCGQLFRLEVYPGGFTADARRYVSVFLTTPGAMNPNHIMYELAILDQSGKDRHIVEKRDSQSRLGQPVPCGGWCNQGPMMSHSRGIVAAVPKFIKAGFLIKHEKRYMPCDMLVLRATVQVLRGWSSAPTVHGHLGYHGGVQAGMMGGQIPALGYGAMPGSMTAATPQQSALAMVPLLPQQHQAQQLQQGSCVCGGLPPHHHVPPQQLQQQQQALSSPPQPQAVPYASPFQQPPGAVLFTPSGPLIPQHWTGNHNHQIQASSQQPAAQPAPLGYYSGSVANYQLQPAASGPDPSSYLVYMSSPQVP